jgi:peptide/nickel transport system substrate-binding protein
LVSIAAVALCVLAACGGGGDDDKSSSSSAPEDQGIPTVVSTPAAKGPIDLVKWGVQYEPSSLDWRLCYSSVENEVVVNIQESLLRFMPDFSLEPSLAESWTHPDPTTYVFKIRQGVQFSDGSELTADDVVYSLNRNKAVESYWATWMTYVKDVKKTGADEVTVTLKKPDAFFLQMMALPAGGIGKQSYIEESGKDYGTPKALPLGTGPLKIDSWKQGSSISMVPNENYWDTEHAAKVGRLDFSFVADESALISALESGQLDGAYFLPYAGVPRLKNSSAGKLYRGKSMLQALVLFTNKEGPLQDPDVRKAWLLATDREAIAKSVFNGAAEPMTDTFVPPAAWAYPEAAEMADEAFAEVGQPRIEIEEAKALIEKAGSPKDVLKVAYRATQQNADMATILQDAGKQIGLNIKGVALQPSQYVNLIFSEEARAPYHAWIADRYWSDIGDPLEIMVEFMAAPEEGIVSYNFNSYDNPVVTKALKEGRETEDPQKRAELARKAQTAGAEDVPVLPLVVPDSLIFMNNKVTGPPASFSYLYYPWGRDLGAP